MILLAEILLSRLLFHSALPAGTDSLSWIAQTAFQARDFRWLYAWRLFGLGFPQSSSLFDLLLIFVHSLVGDPSIAIKLFTLVAFCTAEFSMYSYVFHHTKRHNAALIAAVVYLLNQFVFAEFSEGHIALLFGYALAPLLFLLLDKACARGRVKDCFSLGLMFSIFITGVHLECVYIYGWFMLLYFLIYIIVPNRRTKGRRDTLKRFFKVWGISIPIGISLSSFFLMPIILDIKPAYLSLSYQYTIEETSGILDIFINQIGFHMLFLFFPISLTTIALYRDRRTVFFSLSAFIAAFIAKGTLPPFPEVFEWLFVNVPYMHVFRATSRWFMVTWFAGAFLTGLLVAKSEETLRNILRKAKHELPSHIIDKTKILLTSLMIGIVLLNASLSGLQFLGSPLTYSLPEQDVVSSQWIGSVPGNFRVVTVGSWGLGSNFIIPGPLGSGYREISSEGYYLHDKVVVQNGGWEPLARSFIEFVYSSAYQRKIDDLLRILGLFDVRYVVLSSNAPTEWAEIFYKQYGSKRVLNYSGSVVLENEFWTPHIFAVSRYAAILGGRATLNSLSKVPNLDFAGCGLIYLDQNIGSMTNLLQNADYLIISDSDITDMAMLLLEEDYVTPLEEYGYPSSNPEKHWIVGLAGIDYGKLTRGTLTTGGNNSITMPFEAKEEGEHEVWVRVCSGIGRGTLQLVVDNTTIGSVLSDASFPVSKFDWLSVGSIHLDKGKHTLTLINHSPGYNDVDAVAIVPPFLMQQKMDEASNLLQAFHFRTILVSEAEDFFGEIPALHLKGWNIHQSSFNASNGFVIQSSGRYENVALEGSASASSIQGSGFEASNAIDGDSAIEMTRWASEFGRMPQWFQIEWEQPKDIWELRIFFESAYAEDYQVQIWDGEKWINQTIVEGNAALNRNHIFSQPITTNKVRLYFTSAPEQDSVSVWEVEVYSTYLSKEIYVPKTASYMLGLRLATGPNLGNIRFEFGNVSRTIQTGNPNATYYKWYEIGPIELNAGEESLNMSWVGDLYFDELILYSLKKGEEPLPLDSLLQPSAIPIITHERINPGKYNVQVSSDEPFLLVFTDTYHPSWKAYFGNLEVPPVVAYSVANGFFINKTGNFDVIISFTGQAYADLGWKISAVTVFVLAVVLATPSKVFKSLRNYIRRRT
ncbi:MAG: discoidin domain-containing protein [Candidatus Bathyarchaeota archaeon]|nr:discoidin domain-containing protein [Candidatus Bathyarchaeota archaeon]MDH5495377.1 discoidin domain-containing protein [Candidatus Bathyarchaeota archaeon]